MQYRALITLDWGKPHDPNAQAALIAALMDAGWHLAETTALTIETDDLGRVWEGVELVAKGSTAAGTLTALSFNVIGSASFAASRKYAAKKNHPNAKRIILNRPFPKPK